MGSSENTKLCDLTSHNNSDFICTPIATPATSAPSYEIKPALLNLVMKYQFSGARDAAALHLNNFIELCDMKKYKEVDGDWEPFVRISISNQDFLAFCDIGSMVSTMPKVVYHHIMNMLMEIFLRSREG